MKSFLILPFSPTIFLYACAHVCTLPSYGDNIYDVWYSAIHWLQMLFFLALRIIWNGYDMIWSVMLWNFPDQFLNVGSLDHLSTFSYFLSLCWTLQWITEKPLNGFQSQNLGDEITGEKKAMSLFMSLLYFSSFGLRGVDSINTERRMYCLCCCLCLVSLGTENFVHSVLDSPVFLSLLNI